MVLGEGAPAGGECTGALARTSDRSRLGQKRLRTCAQGLRLATRGLNELSQPLSLQAAASGDLRGGAPGGSSGSTASTRMLAAAHVRPRRSRTHTTVTLRRPHRAVASSSRFRSGHPALPGRCPGSAIASSTSSKPWCTVPAHAPSGRASTPPPSPRTASSQAGAPGSWLGSGSGLLRARAPSDAPPGVLPEGLAPSGAIPRQRSQATAICAAASAPSAASSGCGCGPVNGCGGLSAGKANLAAQGDQHLTAL